MDHLQNLKTSCLVSVGPSVSLVQRARKLPTKCQFPDAAPQYSVELTSLFHSVGHAVVLESSRSQPEV